MNAADLLGFSDLKTKVVKVKGWECSLTIQELGLDDGIKMFDGVKDIDDKTVMTANSIAQVVAWGVVHADTLERVFSDDDVPALAKKNTKVLMFLYQEIMSLSGDGAVKN